MKLALLCLAVIGVLAYQAEAGGHCPHLTDLPTTEESTVAISTVRSTTSLKDTDVTVATPASTPCAVMETNLSSADIPHAETTDKKLITRDVQEVCWFILEQGFL